MPKRLDVDLQVAERTAAVPAVTGTLPPGFAVVDDAIDPDSRKKLHDYLSRPGWSFGWKSNKSTDSFSFWHKHFAGNVNPDHVEPAGAGRQYDCVDELQRNAPLLRELWDRLGGTVLSGHRLLRCYANGQPFGSEGTVHTDSTSDRSFTSIYYPHEKWDANWGGETVFFNRDRSDILTSIYPKPNRLLVFPGTIAHVARGVARICPVLRVTLMFKTERIDS
jgi:SM-20-related protein